MPRSLRPLTMQSLAVTAVATSRMQTSLSRGRGSGTVLIWSTSGGPYAVQTAAFISTPQPVRKCAWQESNLLPFGPEPNALSGELQARWDSPSLNCGPRDSTCDVARGFCAVDRLREPDAPRFQPRADPDATHRTNRGHPSVERRPADPCGVPGLWSDRRLHRNAGGFRHPAG